MPGGRHSFHGASWRLRREREDTGDIRPHGDKVYRNGIVFIGNALKIRLPIDGTTGDDEHSVYGDHGSSAAAEAEIVPKLIPGDVNDDGEVDATDRMILSRYLAKWDGYAAKIKSMDAADIDRNGLVEAKDRMILARYLAKWDGYSQYFK